MRSPRVSDRHRIGTIRSQTRNACAGIVSREGGGTQHPTQGGGCGDMARAGAGAEGMVR
jgi:hypothetical protein